jgi:hypothetical protein
VVWLGWYSHGRSHDGHVPSGDRDQDVGGCCEGSLTRGFLVVAGGLSSREGHSRGRSRGGRVPEKRREKRGMRERRHGGRFLEIFSLQRSRVKNPMMIGKGADREKEVRSSIEVSWTGSLSTEGQLSLTRKQKERTGSEFPHCQSVLMPPTRPWSQQ